jgi:hypothetical protein
MDNDTMGLAELDEDILTFDVQDDALKRAAAAASGSSRNNRILHSLVSP